MESFAAGNLPNVATAVPNSQCTSNLGIASSPAGPGWGFIFGLVLILIFIGFLLIFLISKNTKQEKQLELLHRRINQLPPPPLQEDIVSFIDESHRRHYDATMRRVSAVIDTRLNDFDQYYKSHFVSQQQQPVTKEQLNQPPPLEDDVTTSGEEKDVNSCESGHCQLIQPAHHATPIQPPQPPQPQMSPPPILASGLPSLLANLISNISGSSSESNNSLHDMSAGNSGVSIPMMIGEIMTVYTNQQARQARQLQPSMRTGNNNSDDNNQTTQDIGVISGDIAGS